MKEILLKGALVMTTIVAVYFIFQCYRLKKQMIPKANHSFSPDSMLAPVVPYFKYKDSQGHEHVVIDNKINSIIESETTKKALELAPVIKDIASNLAIEPKQVESYIDVSTTAQEDSIAFLKKELSASQQLSYFYKDKYLTLTVRTKPNSDTLDNGSFDFAYNADLNILQYWKQRYLISGKHSYTEISSNDPRVTIMGVKKFTIEQKQPTLGMRIGMRGTYSTFHNNFAVGPYVRTDIKGWTINGSYLYNTGTHAFGFVVGLDKDIIRF